jgi:hypothetical protein
MYSEVLGEDRFCDILTSVYMTRHDVHAAVSNMANRVWRAVVENTQKMLATILQALGTAILDNLRIPVSPYPLLPFSRPSSTPSSTTSPAIASPASSSPAAA